MAFLGYNFYGWLSDRTGRKILTQWYCVFLVVFGIPVFYVLYHAAIQRNLLMAIVGTVMAAMLKLGWGVVPAYLCERFPTRRRAAGVGFGYSSGALLGRSSASTSGGPQNPVYRSHRETGYVAFSCSHLDHRLHHDVRQSLVSPETKDCGWTKLARRSGVRCCEGSQSTRSSGVNKRPRSSLIKGVLRTRDPR